MQVASLPRTRPSALPRTSRGRRPVRARASSGGRHPRRSGAGRPPPFPPPGSPTRPHGLCSAAAPCPPAGRRRRGRGQACRALTWACRCRFSAYGPGVGQAGRQVRSGHPRPQSLRPQAKRPVLRLLAVVKKRGAVKLPACRIAAEAAGARANCEHGRDSGASMAAAGQGSHPMARGGCWSLFGVSLSATGCTAKLISLVLGTLGNASASTFSRL